MGEFIKAKLVRLLKQGEIAYFNKIRPKGRIDLSGADLPGADLSGADLSGANLSGANLSEASLFRTDLSEANLYKTKLPQSQELAKANLWNVYKLPPEIQEEVLNHLKRSWEE